MPTGNAFTDPAPTTTAGGTSLMDAAKGLQLATTNYGGTASTGTPGARAPITPAATPNTQAGFTPGTATAPSLGTVTADQTVAGNLSKLVDANSPLMQQARSRAMQTANARGLQNSTMAAQSGEEAAIASALPIAQQDASTYQKQSLTNQGAVDTSNALNENIRQSNNATGVQQQSLLESQRQFDTNAKSNQAKLDEDARQFNLTAEQKDRLAQLDTNTKTYLADTQARYQTQIQTSASATDLYKSFQDQVALITTNANMDAPNKQAAINLAAGNLKNGMAVISKINGLDLASILQFQGSAPATAAPTTTGTPDTTAISALTPQQQALYAAAAAKAGTSTFAARDQLQGVAAPAAAQAPGTMPTPVASTAKVVVPDAAAALQLARGAVTNSTMDSALRTAVPGSGATVPSGRYNNWTFSQWQQYLQATNQTVNDLPVYQRGTLGATAEAARQQGVAA